jgi:hypothetical protein
MHARLLLLPLLAAGIALGACSAAPEEETAGDEGALIDLTQAPMSKERLDGIVRQHDVRTLDALPARLPGDFRINFTLKHGKLREGERGHLVERDVSQSADPEAPRVIMWDERSGFTLSYNGGAPGQTEPDRLDVMEFDEATKTFRLSGLQFGGGRAPRYETDADMTEATRKCARCHGPEMRPIFSMYPDWPSFYGSDNDELTDGTKEVQRIEHRDFLAFTRAVRQQSLPRYTPLFDADNIARHLRGTRLYPTFPYRENLATGIEEPSRAFAFRPSLRLGVLQNRLMAQAAMRRIETHRNFASFAPLFLHELLECRWSSAQALQESGWPSAVGSAIGRAPRTVSSGRTLHYRDLLKIFDLDVRDVDIRYSYNHAGYDAEDATTKVMEVGYVAGDYWNSYFDGASTLDELLSMHLYKKLSASTASIGGLVTSPDGLVVKYERRAQRFAFDKNFFTEMDKKGTWIPIPYPRAQLHDAHHREGYPTRFQAQHQALCGALERELASGPTGGGAPPPSAASCPSGCVASSYCKTHANASQAVHVGGLPCMVAGAGGCQPCR